MLDQLGEPVRLYQLQPLCIQGEGIQSLLLGHTAFQRFPQAIVPLGKGAAGSLVLLPQGKDILTDRELHILAIQLLLYLFQALNVIRIVLTVGGHVLVLLLQVGDPAVQLQVDVLPVHQDVHGAQGLVPFAEGRQGQIRLAVALGDRAGELFPRLPGFILGRGQLHLVILLVFSLPQGIQKPVRSALATTASQSARSAAGRAPAAPHTISSS